MEAFGDLQPVGADVLDRRRADGAGYQRQVFQPWPALRQGPLHEVVPRLACPGAYVPGIGVFPSQFTAGNRHVRHKAVDVARQYQVATAAEDEEAPIAGRVEVGQGLKLLNAGDPRVKRRVRRQRERVARRQVGLALDKVRQIRRPHRHGPTVQAPASAPRLPCSCRCAAPSLRADRARSC